MDSGSLSAGVTIIVGLIDWKAILNKCLGDAAANMAKVGRTHFMRHLQPDDRQKVARRAIVLFSEEFLKELDDKSPLSCAISGYQDELRILLESASPDIIGCFRPEIQSVDLGPVSDIWNGLTLTPLPEGFDWRFLAQNYARAIRRQVREDPAMRDQLAIALQEDSHDFEQRFSPGFDLGCYREFLQRKCAILQLSVLHTSAYDRRIALWSVFVAQSARESASGTATLIDDKNARSSDSYRNRPVESVMEILDRRRLVALLGNPGSGKTSLLKYLVLRWVFDDRRHLPLWIDLKEYGRQPMGLKKYLESGQSSFGLDARGIEEQLGDGTAAMYLDGLDEIFSKQIRSSVIEELAAFSAHYPKAPVIITSRIVGYEPDRLREVGFVHATLEDFDDSQVLAFLEKWHAAAEPEDLKERARLQTQIRRAISESRPIRELAGNPLLLT